MYKINILFIALILYFLACTSGNESANIVSDNNKQNEIYISEEQMKEIGLEVGNLKKENVSDGIAVNGYLDTPPQFKANVSSIVGGRIVMIHYLPGNYVKKGQEVVRLESPDFLRLQQNFLEARGELKYLEDEYDRQKKLSESNVNARKIYLQTERDFQSKTAEYHALYSYLKLLDINPETLPSNELSSFIRILAPINGYISEVNRSPGEFVHAEDEVFRMVNPEHLHAELNVFEKDILKVSKGQKVEILLPQQKDSIMTGEVFLVGKELDKDSRTLNVHVHLPEKDNLVVGMYVEARILTSDKEVFIIPTEAIIQEERGTSIFLVNMHDNNQYSFRKVPVKTGTEKNGKTQIFLSEDVTEDTRVAISGVYYLSSN